VCNAKATPHVVNCPHCEYHIWSRGLSFMRCLSVVKDEAWAIVCSLTNNTQEMSQKYYISQVEPRNSQNSSIHIPSARLHLRPSFLPHLAHCQRPELSRHHVTCTKHRLSFENPPDNLHNFVLSLWASFRYMKPYHNANPSDVDSFSTHSNGTKGQPQRKGEG